MARFYVSILFVLNVRLESSASSPPVFIVFTDEVKAEAKSWRKEWKYNGMEMHGRESNFSLTI